MQQTSVCVMLQSILRIEHDVDAFFIQLYGVHFSLWTR